MILNRSTRTLPFVASLSLVASSALGLVVGAKKNLPSGVLSLEPGGSLPQSLAAIGLAAFAAGLAGFVRVIEARPPLTAEENPDSRTHSMLVLAAGVLAAGLHAAAGVALVQGDSRAGGFRALSSAESLAIAVMILASLSAFRATKRLAAMFVGGLVAIGFIVRGALVVAPSDRFAETFAVDPMDAVWVVTSLGFGLWTIVASIGAHAPRDAAPASVRVAA